MPKYSKHDHRGQASGVTADVIALGPLAPPVTGEAIVFDRFLSLVSEFANVRRVRFDRPPGRGTMANVIGRLLAANSASLLLLRSGRKSLYVSFPRGISAFALIGPLLCARFTRKQTFLHHHNVDYLLSPSRTTRAVLAFAGKNANHIVLCDRMADDLSRVYDARRVAALSNAAFVAPANSDPAPSDAFREHSSQLVIGHYSRLGPQKGLDIVLREFEQLRSAGQDVSLALAGPTAGEAADRMIEDSKNRLGSIITTGPLDQENLTKFFRNIDVFLFPSRVEGQGLVALEATAFGVPTVAFDVGCVGNNPGAIVSASESEMHDNLLKMLDAGRDTLTAARERLESAARADQERWKDVAVRLALLVGTGRRIAAGTQPNGQP